MNNSKTLTPITELVTRLRRLDAVLTDILTGDDSVKFHILYSLQTGNPRDSILYRFHASDACEAVEESRKSILSYCRTDRREDLSSLLDGIATLTIESLPDLNDYIPDENARHLVQKRLEHILLDACDLITANQKLSKLQAAASAVSEYTGEPLRYAYGQKINNEVHCYDPDEQGFYLGRDRVNAAEILRRSIAIGTTQVPEKLLWAIDFMIGDKNEYNMGGGSVWLVAQATRYTALTEGTPEVEALRLLAKLGFVDEKRGKGIPEGKVGFDHGQFKLTDAVYLTCRDNILFNSKPNEILAALIGEKPPIDCDLYDWQKLAANEGLFTKYAWFNQIRSWEELHELGRGTISRLFPYSQMKKGIDIAAFFMCNADDKPVIPQLSLDSQNLFICKRSREFPEGDSVMVYMRNGHAFPFPDGFYPGNVGIKGTLEGNMWKDTDGRMTNVDLVLTYPDSDQPEIHSFDPSKRYVIIRPGGNREFPAVIDVRRAELISVGDHEYLRNHPDFARRWTEIADKRLLSEYSRALDIK